MTAEIQGKRPKPAVLIVLDGWGVAPDSDGNAITRAQTPVMNRLITGYPAMTLFASSSEVGLNWGEMGNSEVGHLNIGAGRVYYQMLPRINKDIADGLFVKNVVFHEAIAHVKANKSKLHLIGLVSPGGVHSHQEHLWKLIELAAKEKVKEVYVHAILDGRDAIYNTGVDFIAKLEEVMKHHKTGKIASVCGRYFGMDRDNRWDRVEKAYRLMTEGVGEQVKDAVEAIRASYEKKVYDEEFAPTVIMDKGKPVATIGENDAVICFNFREDRTRELTQAFVLPQFTQFPRTQIQNLYFGTFTEYEKGLPTRVAYPPDIITECLAKVIADAGLTQLHVAETEKYAHVTFFVNGQREEAFLGEERILVPSPHVPSYAQKPEMASVEITAKVVKAIQANTYDFILVNFAAPDMVGHTGDLNATIAGIAAVDACIGKIVNAALALDGVVFITSDHGNAEEVVNLQTGAVDKEHSTNPVPFIIVGKQFEGQNMGLPEGVGADLTLVPPVGVLGDVAPTILKVMNIPQPSEMTGRALI
jgi:2,3-bisphosphoglycerate-independent phosphoglycerate mutase